MLSDACKVPRYVGRAAPLVCAPRDMGHEGAIADEGVPGDLSEIPMGSLRDLSG